MVQGSGKQEKTRECIIEALLSLDREEEGKLIKVNDICGRAGIHRSTFYRYFETKEMMIRELGEDFLSRLEEVYKRIDFSLGITGRLRGQLMDMLRFYEENRDMALFLIFRNNDPVFRKKYYALFSEYYISFIEGCGVDIDPEYWDIFLDCQIGGGLYLMRQYLEGKYDSLDRIYNYTYEYVITDLRKLHIKSGRKRKTQSVPGGSKE